VDVAPSRCEDSIGYAQGINAWFFTQMDALSQDFEKRRSHRIGGFRGRKSQSMTVPSIDEYCFKVAIGIPADNQVLLKGLKDVIQIAQ